jgi:adenylosuccinate lyase
VAFFRYTRNMKHAISPLDGRYEKDIESLRHYFSEEALMRYRVLVEIRWFEHLASRSDIPLLRDISEEERTLLESVFSHFSDSDASRIKEIEKTTNHDVKAIEYFLKEKIADSSLAELSEWIHFSLTSEDVNNLAYALMLKKALHEIILPELEKLMDMIGELSRTHASVAMLSRTHGQPASPTTLGKEFLIFAHRLQRQLRQLKNQEFFGKLAGASGNFNAHVIAFPNADWLDISQTFVESLGLSWNPVVPQIEPHDFIAELSHILLRVGTIGIDFSRDIWGYIALRFFRQKLKEGEVGSSAMPHKVNPIDFENAEGNFGIGNSLFSHFAQKLPISRWQRDLSDSTVLRNVGVAFGHHFLALKNLQKGLGKLEINTLEISKDLDSNREVLAEAVQTVMRANGMKNPYETLKQMTRGKSLSQKDYSDFILTLELPQKQQAQLLDLTPEKYTGLAEAICKKFAKNLRFDF